MGSNEEKPEKINRIEISNFIKIIIYTCMVILLLLAIAIIIVCINDSNKNETISKIGSFAKYPVIVILAALIAEGVKIDKLIKKL